MTSLRYGAPAPDFSLPSTGGGTVTLSGLKGTDLPKDLGFAGFRVNFHTDLTRDITAFLGASYFRAVGGEWQYGLSARGLAIDAGMQRPEEFPIFTDFWLERPAKNASKLVVYALLDSPSVAGAYRFEIQPLRLETGKQAILRVGGQELVVFASPLLVGGREHNQAVHGLD